MPFLSSPSRSVRRSWTKCCSPLSSSFPASRVYRGEQTPRQWLAASTDGVPHRAAAIEEMMLLWMANRNPAFRPFEELFEDRTLAEKTAYRKVAEQFPAYFATRPLVPIEGAAPVNLYDLLRAPAVSAPGSLSEQLSVIRKQVEVPARRRPRPLSAHRR